MSAPALPLIEGFVPHAPLVWHDGRTVAHGAFVAQARRLAAQLPDAPYAINLCEDRYRFMLAFAAVCLRGQTNLLPSSGAAAAIDAVAARHARHYRLRDADVAVVDAGTTPADEVPLLAADHLAAVLFTSGSTGTPQACPKHWRTMSAIGRHLAERLLGSVPAQVVATVPPQHMYGLETTVLMPLAGRCAVHGGRPFFPQDVAEALHALPAPRVLVTTPVHLRALVEHGTALPPLAFILSATAPLGVPLAAAAEARWNAPVHEIYGCTEAGSTATRRTTDGERWHLLHGMRLHVDGERTIVSATHLPEATPLQDRIERDDDEHFRLLGRNADLLKVGGKRGSLAELTQKLMSVPGVVDAVVFNAGEGEAARPAALVVAPDVGEAQILEALARTIDPVFLPRPLRRVAELPRNETGKLARATLLELLGRSA